MKFIPDIHHRRSIRFQQCDYSTIWAYFVTICTQGRECLFGDIVDGTMLLNPAGEIIRAMWDGLPGRFSNVMTDEFMIMPNHFYGIIILNERPHDVSIRRGEPCVRPGRGAARRALDLILFCGRGGFYGGLVWVLGEGGET